MSIFYSPLTVSLEIGTAGVAPALAVLPPEVPSVPLDGTDAMLTEAQAQAVRGLAESNGYSVSMLAKRFEGRPDRLVVIAGECHVKGRKQAKPGTNAVVVFPHRGIELGQFPISDGRPFGLASSTMGAALLYGLPQPHKDFIRAETWRQYAARSSFADLAAKRGAIIHLRSGLYSRNIFFDADRLHSFLGGDEVLGDEAPVLLEEGDAAHQILSQSVYRQLGGAAACSALSIISSLLPYIAGASNAASWIAFISAACSIGLTASAAIKISHARSVRDRHMAGRINSAIAACADDLPWLNIVGAAHVAGISNFLTDACGFVPIQVP